MPSHWNSSKTLDGWLQEHGISAIKGIDTRELTQKIREHGTMLGKIVMEGHIENVEKVDPSKLNLVDQVSVKVK